MSENPNQGARPRPYRLAELGLLILAIAVSTIAYALVGTRHRGYDPRQCL